MDVITLKNMDFFGHTGVLPEEKENGQLFTVTAELFYDEIRGAETDRLEDTTNYAELYALIKELVEKNFQPTFWNAGMGFLADYVDNGGQHLELRPNQLWAVSLDYRCVDDEVVSEVMRVVNAELVTRRGIRSLSPRDSRYKGVYEGSQIDRDLAYHNGCAFPDLLAQYCYASFNMMGKYFVKRAEWLTEGFYEDLSKHGVGCFSELYDGDPPHEPHGAISSALTTAALLNINWLIAKYREE